jgi:hypothetical protein
LDAGRQVGDREDGFGAVQEGGQPELPTVEDHGGRQLRDAVRGRAVGEEDEWQVVRPVRAAFVGGDTHSSERTLYAFGDTLGLWVIFGALEQVNACPSVYGLGEQVCEVRAAVGAQLSGPPVAARYVAGESVERLFGCRVTMERDNLDPTGEGICEYEDLCEPLIVRLGHVAHIADH